MEDKPRRPEWMYTTLLGTPDREAEEQAIQEEEKAAERAEEAAKSRPPTFGAPGGPPPVDPKTGEPVQLWPGRPEGSSMPGRNPPRPDVPTKGAKIDD